MVKNWVRFYSLYNYYLDPANNFDGPLLTDTYNHDNNAYLKDLLDAFGDTINMFSNEGDATGTNFHSITLDATNTVTTINCNCRIAQHRLHFFGTVKKLYFSD